MSKVTTARVRAEKRSGDTWRIVGAECICGGMLIIDRCGSRGEFLYEVYCKICKTCDPNGWPTIAACLENSPEYFGAGMS